MAVGLAFLCLTGLWRETLGVDAARHTAYEVTLRDLQRLDRTLNQDVLRSRVQLINSYDSLVATARKTSALRRDLAALPTYINDDDRAELHRAITDYQASLAAKAALVETFKSRNAVLKNSLRYLPTFAPEVAAAARAEAPRTGIADAIDALLQAVLVYNLTSDERLAPQITAGTTALEARKEDLSAGTGANLGLLLAHVRAIAQTKPEVDGLLRDIFEGPIVSLESQVYARYHTGFDHATTRANILRSVLYAACVALVGLVATFFQRLRRALFQLDHANSTLEAKVVERTASLDGRNSAMRLVLDNVDQGFITIGRDGALVSERSAALDQDLRAAGLGPHPHIWSWLATLDRKAAAWVQIGWDDLFADSLPFEVVADQLPQMVSDGKRHLRLEFRPLRTGSAVTRVLLVVTDLTELVVRGRSEAEGKDLLAALEHVLADRDAFTEFVDDTDALLARVTRPDEPPVNVFRDIHTLKGNASLFGLATMSAACDVLEDQLAEEPRALTTSEVDRLASAWQRLTTRLRQIALAKTDEFLELTPDEYQDLLKGAESAVAPDELRRQLVRLRDEPAARRLGRFADTIRAISNRLGKGGLVVRVEPNGVRFDRERFAPLWATFVHVLRNAVDHGIEGSADERLRRGKPANGEITLIAQESAGGTIVDVRDDGVGIDWERVAARAESMNLPASTREELIAAIFADGLTTRDAVSELSGRGVGLSALRQAVQALGGSVEVESEPGYGTTVRCRIPLRAA